MVTERMDSRASGKGSEHDPGVGEDRVIIVSVSSGAVEIGAGAVEFVPQYVLQTDAHVQPWPEGWPAMAERKVRDLGDPAAAVRASGESAVKRRIRGAAYRHPAGRKAPGVVVDIRERDVEAPQCVVRIVGEPQRPAG